jgi:hypothetical protein
MAIGAVKLQLVTPGCCTVTAEVASSSLVVPPLRNDWLIQLQPATQPTKATALLRSSPRRPERDSALNRTR